jgi:hypothetical protein
MIYRPQFGFPPTPPGFSDETFHYSFDSTTVSILGLAVTAGAVVNEIALQLQNDAEFICRGLKVQLGTAASNLYMQLKDPFGNCLSACPVALSDYLTGAGIAVVGRMIVPFESEIVCPISGRFMVNFYNPTTGPIFPPALTFFGVKRYVECAA